MISFLLGAAPAATERHRAFSGEIEYGEKYTSVYDAGQDPDVVDDDEDFDRYQFTNAWLQYDHKLRKGLSLSVRGQQVEREYVSRPILDNSTTFAQLRLAIEPSEGWAVWPKFSIRERDYDQRSLDNTILDGGVECRYRWGVRDNVRFGASYTDVSYDVETARDRASALAFVAVEKPFSEQLTLRAGARYEATEFDVQSPSRENASKGSGSVGFRYEF